MRVKKRIVTVSSRLFRSLRLLHNRQLTVLVYAPQSLEGKIITREPQCQRDRQCRYPAFHNIIPSELCNSRRHRQCPASREEVSRGQKPAKTAYRASDYTIRIMLRTLRRQSAKVLPSNSRVRRRRTSSPLQGPPGLRPVRGLRTLLTRKVQVRIPSVLCEGKEPAGIRSAMRAVRRLTQLRCWVVPGRDSSSSAGSVRRVPSLHSAVRLRRVYPSLLFLHTSAGKNPARSVPGRQGQLFRLLAQTVSVYSASKPQPKLPQTAPGAWCKA